jgi:hypothetical protein
MACPIQGRARDLLPWLGFGKADVLRRLEEEVPEIEGRAAR